VVRRPKASFAPPNQSQVRVILHVIQVLVLQIIRFGSGRSGAPLPEPTPNYLQDLVHAEVWEGGRKLRFPLPKLLHVLGPVFDL